MWSWRTSAIGISISRSNRDAIRNPRSRWHAGRGQGGSIGATSGEANFVGFGLRLIKGDDIITGPYIEPMRFKSRLRGEGLVARRTIQPHRSPRSVRTANARQETAVEGRPLVACSAIADKQLANPAAELLHEVHNAASGLGNRLSLFWRDRRRDFL
jgi:hypothetical protein